MAAVDSFWCSANVRYAPRPPRSEPRNSRKDTETAKRPFVPFAFFVSFVVHNGGDERGGQFLVQRQYALCPAPVYIARVPTQYF